MEYIRRHNKDYIQDICSEAARGEGEITTKHETKLKTKLNR